MRLFIPTGSCSSCAKMLKEQENVRFVEPHVEQNKEGYGGWGGERREEIN